MRTCAVVLTAFGGLLVAGGCNTHLVKERSAPAEVRLKSVGETLTYPKLTDVPDGPPRRPTRQADRQDMIRSLRGGDATPDRTEPGEPVPPAPVQASEASAGGMAPATAGPAPAGPGAVQLAQASGKSRQDGRPAIEINRDQIPQMSPSTKGKPVQLPDRTSPRRSGDSGVTPAASGGTKRIAVIYFGHGRAGLDGQDRRVLQKVATIHDRTDRSLRIVGHSSSQTRTLPPVKHRMVNFDMSMRRAENVANALTAMGVPADAVRVQARANRDPVYHEFMPSGAAGNRRAEVFLRASR